MADFNQIDEARKLLGLGDTATSSDIKRAYKTLAQNHHPDKAGDVVKQDGVMKKLNWAYKVLTEYCDDYAYSFKEEDVARTYPHDEYLRKYRYRWFDGI